jgi:hypothetical protein
MEAAPDNPLRHELYMIISFIIYIEHDIRARAGLARRECMQESEDGSADEQQSERQDRMQGLFEAAQKAAANQLVQILFSIALVLVGWIWRPIREWFVGTPEKPVTENSLGVPAKPAPRWRIIAFGLFVSAIVALWLWNWGITKYKCSTGEDLTITETFEC